MLKWFVIRTTPSGERKAEKSLNEAGFEHYCPWIREIKTPPQRKISHSRRRNLAAEAREVFRPLYKNYIFARPASDGCSIYALPGMNGIQGLIAFGERFAFVSNAEVDAIKFSVDNGLMDMHHGSSSRHNFVVGQMVMLKTGFFAGRTGKVERIDKAGKISLAGVEGPQARVVTTVEQIEALEQHGATQSAAHA